MSESEGLRRQKSGREEHGREEHQEGQSSKSMQQGAADDTAAGGGGGGGGSGGGGGGTKIAVFTPRTGKGGLDEGGARRTQGTMAPAAPAAVGGGVDNGDGIWGVMHAQGTHAQKCSLSKVLSIGALCSKWTRALTCENSGSVADVANCALPLRPTHVRRPASAPAAVVPKVC